METKTPCYYSVVRYVDDPLRFEPRNIGVILQCKEKGYVHALFLSNLRSKFLNNG